MAIGSLRTKLYFHGLTLDVGFEKSMQTLARGAPWSNSGTSCTSRASLALQSGWGLPGAGPACSRPACHRLAGIPLRLAQVCARLPWDLDSHILLCSCCGVLEENTSLAYLALKSSQSGGRARSGDPWVLLCCGPVKPIRRTCGMSGDPEGRDRPRRGRPTL